MTLANNFHLSSSLRILAIALVTGQVLGCTTFGRSEDNSAAIVKAEESNQVVTQIGQDEAVISQHDRSYWLGLRANGSHSLAKARGALATGESDAAADMARAFLSKNPGNIEGLTVLAASLAMSRKYELAAYYAGLVDKAQPGQAVALNIKGLAVMLGAKNKATDLRKAADLFKAAFAISDNQIAPGLNLGHLQLELGDAQAALGTFSEVQRRCHNCSTAMLGVGVAASRAGKNDLALAAFKAVLAEKPNDSAALYHLALVYKNGYNDRKQAEKTLSKMLSDQKSGDPYMKEKAQTVLRELKGEADQAERTLVADEDAPTKKAAPNSSNEAKDEADADLMMSAAEMDSE